MSSIHRSIFFSAIERYGSLLLLFLSTAVLSRLLTPQEFGIFAVVNALTTVIAASFQEFGGANYLVQKTDLSEDNVRTAFTVTACISALAAAVLYLFSDKLALLFSQQGLGIGITVSVLNFLLTPFSTTIVALLRRNMDFGALALCALLGNVTGVAVSIVLALLHYSFLAPIWGAIAGAAVQTLCLIFRQNDLRIFRPSLSGFQDVVGFGLYSGGIVVINIFYNFAPQLFLARILDFTAVGLYSRAINITQVFDKFVIQALTPVIMPAIFSQIKAGANLKKLYLDAIAMLSVIHWPSLIFVAVMARPIILIWLGPSWLDVVPLIRILCVAYLSLFASCLTYPVLVAAGGVRDALNSSLISLPPSLLVILASSFYGVKAVAASALLTLPFQVAIALYFVCRRLDLSLADLLRALFKSSMVTLCSSIGVLVCAGLVEHGAIGPLLGLVCACVSMAVCWLAALIAIRHPLLPRLQAAINSLLAAALPIRMGGPAKTLHSSTDVR